MYFVDKIKKEFKNKDLTIFVDMDGVVADYDFGTPLDFKNKRPITTNIKTIEELSKLKNVEVKILSICRKNNQIHDKLEWLNHNMPFITEDNRFIISKETISKSSKEIKLDFLRKYITDNKTIILIDDDNAILKYIKDNLHNIILFQDSSIID